jgi:hypothetical protein
MPGAFGGKVGELEMPLNPPAGFDIDIGGADGRLPV